MKSLHPAGESAAAEPLKPPLAARMLLIFGLGLAAWAIPILAVYLLG